MSIKKDNKVNDDIMSYLDLSNPKSFFLLAGAGSGKTRTLVNTLETLNDKYGNNLKKKGKQIAVITYTNAACNEIISRLHFNELFSISTIHSFAWELISSFQYDIKKYIKNKYIEKIIDLEKRLEHSKNTTTKSYLNRKLELVELKQKLNDLKDIKQFIYSPTGSNSSKNSLNHADVIKICSEFLSNELMQSIVAAKYPIILIDECQDTNKYIMDAIIRLQNEMGKKISIGLFGDMMQRVYYDGKSDLDTVIADFEKPVKIMNYRSTQRIVELINNIRNDYDGLKQVTYKKCKGLITWLLSIIRFQPSKCIQKGGKNYKGKVNLFICRAESNRSENEKRICSKMKELTRDEQWIISHEALVLEHHMAAKRQGFSNIFDSLSEESSYKERLLDGDISELMIFRNQIIPILSTDSKYVIMKILKENSPLFCNNDEVNMTSIEKASIATAELVDSLNKEPSCIDLLKIVKKHTLFKVHDNLSRIISIDESEATGDIDDKKVNSLYKALNCKYSEVYKYYNYIDKKSGFTTHQGVKGLEYDRIMLIIDPSEEKGSMFDYMKLFGISKLSTTDKDNISSGKDNSLARTKRLFYVGCSRAKKSLAIVFYVNNPSEVRSKILSSGWFKENEIIIM